MEAFKRARVGFTSIQESVDTASASGELFFNLVASVSQWERRAIGERTYAAMAHLRAQGQRISRQPRFGARFDAAGRVQADPREQATLSTILRLREAGLSLRAISAELVHQGILARSGRPFTASTLGQLVRQGSLADSLAS
jgi:DNA invertase Pin-like site-specific DNA recombinase